MYGERSAAICPVYGNTLVLDIAADDREYVRADLANTLAVGSSKLAAIGKWVDAEDRRVDELNQAAADHEDFQFFATLALGDESLTHGKLP